MKRPNFTYRGCYVTHCPHPLLKGNYEINFTEYAYYIGRYDTKKQCKKAINDFYNSYIYNTYFRMHKLYNQ